MVNRYRPDIRIGIPMIGDQAWVGGISYVEVLLSAIRSLPRHERPQMFLLCHDAQNLNLYQSALQLIDGLLLMPPVPVEAASVLRPPSGYCSNIDELFKHIDFYFPANITIPPKYNAAYWIPDFQHIHLPQFFSQEERDTRDKEFLALSRLERLLVLSSKDAQSDFHRLFPEAKAKTRVLSFYSLPPPRWFSPNPADVTQKYQLPREFLICCNQFWAHKNHLRLFEALAMLRAEGINLHLVCTGTTSDRRAETYFTEVLKRIQELGVSDQVHILGLIPRDDQIQLLRAAMAVIQPSLFEGWSTVVEDARAFGKTVVLSDLPVHKEQNPKHCIFFDRHSSEDLRYKIKSLLPHLSPGPDLQREEEARIDSSVLVRQYANNFCSLAEEAIEICKEQTPIS